MGWGPTLPSPACPGGHTEHESEPCLRWRWLTILQVPLEIRKKVTKSHPFFCFSACEAARSTASFLSSLARESHWHNGTRPAVRLPRWSGGWSTYQSLERMRSGFAQPKKKKAGQILTGTCYSFALLENAYGKKKKILKEKGLSRNIQNFVCKIHTILLRVALYKKFICRKLLPLLLNFKKFQCQAALNLQFAVISAGILFLLGL